MGAGVSWSTVADRRTLRVAVVGPGRLGGALCAALVAAGYAPPLVVGRRPERVDALVRALPGARTGTPDALAGGCDLVLIAVPDDAVAAVAGTLPVGAAHAVVHTSGALGLDALADAARRGAAVGALHPLQTFPAGEPPAIAAERFRGIVCGVEGDGALGRLLETLAGDLGASSVRLEGVDRAGYHAAAVIVSNDVVALMSAATRAWALAGLDAAGARVALAPLMSAAADNVRALPLARALTGPVARGDAATVARHLEALAADPALAALYRALARELLTVELGHDPATRAALLSVLDAPAGV